MSTPLVDRETAMAKQTHHQFIPGIGYLAHSAPPPLLPEHTGDKNCKPPAGTRTGSLHKLQPPGKGAPMTMRWVAAEGAWASPKPGKGHRLAFTCEHLSKAGWQYVAIAK